MMLKMTWQYGVKDDVGEDIEELFKIDDYDKHQFLKINDEPKKVK